MSPNRPSTTSRSIQDTDLESKNECEICGSTDSLSKYSFESSSGDSSTIVLCSSHYQVAVLLSGSRFLDSDISTDYSLQETKKITVRVPRALIEGADSVAEQEGQTRSEFVRDGIQMAMEIQDMEEAFNDIISQAVQSQPDSETESDVEFLKDRIRNLESLLEDSINKI
ncbi:ribbon-helix-helix domain-containing protein [Natrinema sp. HArc-T2]|uniref:ribbon-helix-helix domain-containing protein n=1 Tax=Natrinema sp. HArc-T2 TaxID=3242701 RepID=UPI00359DAA08